MLSKAMGICFVVAVFSGPLAAKTVVRSNTDPVVLSFENGKAKCLGYPMAVPTGVQDAVVTVAECAPQSGTALTLTDGSTSRPLEVVSEAGLAVLRFPSGTVSKTETLEAKAEFGYLPGSPILNDAGEIQGLVNHCVVEGDIRCEAVDLKKEGPKTVIAKLNESLWGADNVAVSGSEHQKRCRLFGRGGGGGFRYHGGYSHVSVNIVVVVVVVQRPVVVVQQPGCSSNCGGSCSDDSYRRGYEDGRRSMQNCSDGYRRGYHQGRLSSHSEFAEYTPPPPPPRQSYVGVYDPSAGASDFTFTTGTEVSSNTGTLLASRKPAESSLAAALPAHQIVDRSALYAANLEGSDLSLQPASLWAMKRSVTKPELLVANSKGSNRPAKVTLVMR